MAAIPSVDQRCGDLGTEPPAIASHGEFTDVGLDSLLAVALTRRLGSTSTSR
ncbi:acyl carrier protein [Saccharothrix isguenensis]